MSSLKHFKIIGPLALLTCTFGCGNEPIVTEYTDVIVDGPITKPIDTIEATDDQKARRTTSEAYCTSRNIPIYENPNSLFVESENTVEIRTKHAVVDRALALSYLGLKSEGIEESYLNEFAVKYTIAMKFTPEELAFASSSEPTQQQMVDANWQYESLHVMLWTLGYIDSLGDASQICNVATDMQIIHERTEQEFRDGVQMRSAAEILDNADLILRLNWACVNARVNNKSAPGGLDGSVVYERHYSLNWLIRKGNQAWDDVTTDT
jgi:hypothetical protein